MSLKLSANSCRGLSEVKVGESAMIIGADEGKNVSDVEFLWCGQGPGSNTFFLGN